MTRHLLSINRCAVVCMHVSKYTLGKNVDVSSGHRFLGDAHARMEKRSGHLARKARDEGIRHESEGVWEPRGNGVWEDFVVQFIIVRIGVERI